ncbi:hypothetical protein M9H77_12671 [Catharanthus roseus]|uniref:Uncharacterized protein n=1 Tax=Catharanthus roseus TaxID=4058 RepID=A0ACC0BI26_CATRO|nr:hypothetical protein M9H77_12671 [Catharanthus roseus]
MACGGLSPIIFLGTHFSTDRAVIFTAGASTRLLFLVAARRRFGLGSLILRWRYRYCGGRDKKELIEELMKEFMLYLPKSSIVIEEIKDENAQPVVTAPKPRKKKGQNCCCLLPLVKLLGLMSLIYKLLGLMEVVIMILNLKGKNLQGKKMFNNLQGHMQLRLQHQLKSYIKFGESYAFDERSDGDYMVDQFSGDYEYCIDDYVVEEEVQVEHEVGNEINTECKPSAATSFQEVIPDTQPTQEPVQATENQSTRQPAQAKRRRKNSLGGSIVANEFIFHYQARLRNQQSRFEAAADASKTTSASTSPANSKKKRRNSKATRLYEEFRRAWLGEGGSRIIYSFERPLPKGRSKGTCVGNKK